MIAPRGAPGRVLDAARRGLFQPVASWLLAEEIVEVLRRPHLAQKYKFSEVDVKSILLLLAPLLPSIETAAKIRDADDLPVVASAIVAEADAIVTGDRDFLDDTDLRAWLAGKGIAIYEPREFVSILES